MCGPGGGPLSPALCFGLIGSEHRCFTLSHIGLHPWSFYFTLVDQTGFELLSTRIIRLTHITNHNINRPDQTTCTSPDLPSSRGNDSSRPMPSSRSNSPGLSKRPQPPLDHRSLRHSSRQLRGRRPVGLHCVGVDFYTEHFTVRV